LYLAPDKVIVVHSLALRIREDVNQGDK
jgi:hypothetical protein